VAFSAGGDGAVRPRGDVRGFGRARGHSCVVQPIVERVIAMALDRFGCGFAFKFRLATWFSQLARPIADGVPRPHFRTAGCTSYFRRRPYCCR
jgi:hypothetical protein